MKESPKHQEIETTPQKTIKSISQVLGWISVGIVTVVYFLSGFFTITATGATVQDILTKIAVSLLVGISIARGWAKQGLLAGMKDATYIDAAEAHKSSIIEAQDYFEFSEEWEQMENDLSLNNARKLILGEAGLPYNKFFDSEGEFIGSFYPTENLSKEDRIQNITRNKAIKAAIRHKVTPVITSNLTSLSVGDTKDRNSIGKIASELDKASLVLETLVKVGTAIIFGMWTLGTVTSTGQLVQTLIELALFQVAGALGYYSRYMFKTENEVNVLVKKTTLLKRLVQYGKNKKEVIANGNKPTESSETEGISVRTDSFSV